MDWAIPASEGGSPWEAYDWALDRASELDDPQLTIVGAAYESLGRLDLAVGREEANRLRVQPHAYSTSGIRVQGVTTRGYWSCKGVVLVAWANDEVMAEVESQRPAAIAAVATWPDSIPAWLSVYTPERIGQHRPEQEAEFEVPLSQGLDEDQLETLGPLRAINENHSALATDERYLVARTLLELRRRDRLPDQEPLEEHLMSLGWNGTLIKRTLKLAEDVRAGKNPRTR